MLLRRYFLFPEKPQAIQAVRELNDAGIKDRSIHAQARNAEVDGVSRALAGFGT